MSRLVVVSNRVAPIKAGKVAAGGLAVGVYDALRQAGGIWFGWSGEVSATPAINTEEVGNITYVTLPLNKRDYDQYYRGFSNATLWPIFHYRIDLARYSREEVEAYIAPRLWVARGSTAVTFEKEARAMLVGSPSAMYGCSRWNSSGATLGKFTALRIVPVFRKSRRAPVVSTPTSSWPS